MRELKNCLSRLHLEGREKITLEEVERTFGDVKTTTLFPRNLLVSNALSDLKDQLEKDYIICHFRRLEGSTDALCEFLALSSRQLYRRCVRLGIHLREERKKSS